MHTLLALDLGTKSGFCMGQPGGSTMSGTADFKPGRYNGGGMRFVKFRAWLNDLKSAYPIDRVVFEEVRRHAGTDAAHVYGGLMATLTAWCEELEIPYEGVSVGEIKKSFTTRGNASKDEMIAEAIKRGYAPMTHDEADAIALWHCKIGEMEARPPPKGAVLSEMEG